MINIWNQESESELEGLDDVEDDAEEEHENDLEVPVEAEPVLKKPPEPSVAAKEAERQLSKKELKKKELEELDAVLAELGLTQKESSGQDESHGNIMLLNMRKNYFKYLSSLVWNIYLSEFCLFI